jgi:hypothetical protein
LFTQKSGYCTYFASAMTVMLRSTGVPARMVTGFLTSQYIQDSHRSILRDHDFHAWTEVYFPKYGWITLDSTPGNPLSQTDPNYADVFAGAVVSTETPQTPAEEAPVPEIPQPISAEKQANLFVFIIPAIIIALLVLYFWFNRKTRYGPELYTNMIFLATLSGSGPKTWQTSLEFSEQLSSALPAQAPVIGRIISNYTIGCYSSEKTSGQNEVDKKSWLELKKVLIKRIFHAD